MHKTSIWSIFVIIVEWFSLELEQNSGCSIFFEMGCVLFLFLQVRSVSRTEHPKQV